MSGPTGAHRRRPDPSFAARRRRSPIRGRAGLVTALLVATLAGGGLASADPPSGSRRLDPATARSAGLAVAFTRVATPAGAVLGVSLPTVAGVAADPSRLLAVAPDGTAVASADVLGERFGTLSVAFADGSLLQVELPGLSSAAFAPDASWLGVLDSDGSLWRIDVATGATTSVAVGPFSGPPLLRGDGTVDLLSVASVEAPWRSVAVRLDLASGKFAALSDESLVYALLPAAGDLPLLVAHRPDGLVLRWAGPDGGLIAVLPPGVVGASVSTDGSVIAYVLDDEIIVLGLDRTPRRLAAGDHPQVAPGGSAIMLRQGDQTAILTVDGTLLVELPTPTASFIECGEECGS